MTPTQSMTMDAADAYRRGLAEGFEAARERAAMICAGHAAWTRSTAAEGSRLAVVAEDCAVFIFDMGPPA